MSSYNKNIGLIGENFANKYLAEKGFIILLKNFKTRFAEVDIIAKKNNKISFVEVKTRIGKNKGLPYESINRVKLRHVKAAAEYYLLINKIKDCKLSIDVVSIVLNADKSLNQLNFYEGVEL